MRRRVRHLKAKNATNRYRLPKWTEQDVADVQTLLELLESRPKEA